MSFFSNLSNIFTTPPSKTAGKGKPVAAPAQGKATPAKPDLAKQLPGKEQQPTVTTSKVTAPAKQSVAEGLRAPQPVPIAPRVDPKALAEAQSKADAILREAQSKSREIIVEAKDEALAIRGKAEKQEREVVRALEDQQRDLNQKLDKIDLRLSQIDDKEARLEQQRADLETRATAIETAKQEVLNRLEEVSGMTKDQATALLMDGLEKRLSRQMAQLVKQKEEEAQAAADDKVQEILVDAMKHGATDYVAEYTISTVTLPHEEAKGKIIGKSGRNIHAFEKVTGVDVDLDGSPTEVRLSCFDPVRREIGRISLERLIKDGRIQPTRIEEVVDKVRGEIDKITFEAGKKLCHDVGVYNLPTDLMKMLGKFKYRFSYGQNLIGHTLEETRIGIKLAHELKADVNVVKLGCLLHDIGKVSDEVEGSHVELGVKIAKKYGMPQPVIDCIAQHHEDEPFTGVEQMIVYIADTISGARPGARYENYDEYVKRLQSLEEIAMAYEGVRQAYAIQAGREVRVLLDPEVSADNDVLVLATKIRDEIKEKMTYPGTVTVNVSRETRSQQVAT